MQLFIRFDKTIVINVDPNENTECIRTIIYYNWGIPPREQIITFRDKNNNLKILYDGKSFADYSICNNCFLNVRYKLRGGGCCCEAPSIVSEIQYDLSILKLPLIPGNLCQRYIRNTNATRTYKQKGRTCYAYAAISAYINAIMRIYGERYPPSFAECYDIAAYNGENGGIPSKSIQLLEDHFHYGICFENKKKISIREAITLSPIISFSTSKKGWNNVANGKLLRRPQGPEDGWHASIIEGYDFNQKCFICKNSWGGISAKPRFDIIETATHDCEFTVVYFTLDSIRNTNIRMPSFSYFDNYPFMKKIISYIYRNFFSKPIVFEPKMIKFEGKWKEKKIDCAWMDEETAIYSTDYVCQPFLQKHDQYDYLGYDIDQWISINLNNG